MYSNFASPISVKCFPEIALDKKLEGKRSQNSELGIILNSGSFLTATYD